MLAGVCPTHLSRVLLWSVFDNSRGDQHGQGPSLWSVGICSTVLVAVTSQRILMERLTVSGDAMVVFKPFHFSAPPLLAPAWADSLLYPSHCSVSWRGSSTSPPSLVGLQLHQPPQASAGQSLFFVSYLLLTSSLCLLLFCLVQDMGLTTTHTAPC